MKKQATTKIIMALALSCAVNAAATNSPLVEAYGGNSRSHSHNKHNNPPLSSPQREESPINEVVRDRLSTFLSEVIRRDPKIGNDLLRRVLGILRPYLSSHEYREFKYRCLYDSTLPLKEDARPYIKQFADKFLPVFAELNPKQARSMERKIKTYLNHQAHAR